MEKLDMPRKNSAPAKPTAQPAPTPVTWRGAFSLEEREAMIRDAAYFHYAKRGYAPGHELEDWLAAEAQLEREAATPSATPTHIEVQQSGVRGASKDEKIKQTVKRSPRKAIPQIEGIEPENAPFKE
jgi:hypothetical protein